MGGPGSGRINWFKLILGIGAVWVVFGWLTGGAIFSLSAINAKPILIIVILLAIFLIFRKK